MPELYYFENGKWISLPDWSSFLIKLGYVLATAGEQDKRLIAGLAVPARAYAACLTAAGAVMGRALIPVNGPAGEEEHFNNLCLLEYGTSLNYIRGNRKKKAIFAGVTTFNGELRIKIQTESKEGGGLTELLNKKMALAVSVASDGEVKLPKKQSGHKIVPRKAFLDNLLPGVDTNIFALFSRLDCVIVGPAALVRREVTDTRLAVRLRRGKFAEGTFQDLLRVRRFLFEGKAYRTDVYSVNGSRQLRNGSTSPAVAIFDGALAFLKWRDMWTGSNWVVLLDRTCPNFWEGAEALNQDFIKNRTLKNPELDLPPVTAGIEMILYEVAPR
ncbi:MAG: hypothetical protein K6T65_03775 [Peptococcaceae bacterium]|nr:hypothetical protein [Peptococcaceae bacterium]